MRILSSSENVLIKNANLVLPDRIEKNDLLIQSGKIEKIGARPYHNKSFKSIDAEGKYLLPGFIDIHNHGATQFDFSLGIYHPEQRSFHYDQQGFLQGLEEYLRFFLMQGATRIVPTTLATSVGQLKRSFGSLRDFVDSKNRLASMIHGINLEGTFLKMKAYAGAQDPQYFFPPRISLLQELQKASGDLLRIVNVPPEHGAEGLNIIDQLVNNHIIVAGGHSGANSDQFDLAIQRGLSLGVHFLNGPSKSSSKSFFGGGAVESMLKSDNVTLEIIADGYHVHPAYIRDTLVRKSDDKIILITDSMFANGFPIESFDIGGIPGRLSANGEYLEVVNKPDTLFGSVLTPLKAFENMVNWLTTDMPGVWHRIHPALDLHEAIQSVSKMISSNPARLLDIDGSTNVPGTGSISVGNWADLVLVEIHREQRISLEINRVFLKGIDTAQIV